MSNDGVSYGKLHLDKIKESSKNTVNLTEHKRQDSSVFAEATEARRRWSRQRECVSLSEDEVCVWRGCQFVCSRK